MTTLRYCVGCFHLRQENNVLRAENEKLKAQLRAQERSAREGAFGASTPSSKIPIKPNTLGERQARCGGLKPGHAGHGRTALSEEAADRLERVALSQETCPDCGVKLLSAGPVRRTVTDLRVQRVEKVLLHLERKRCPQCKRRWTARAPGVLPKGLYTNALLAQMCEPHSLHGIPLGVIERQTGLAHGALLPALRQVAARLEGAVESLVAKYRKAPVKHADETGWRTDGQNGYVWLFATPQLSLFRFRSTRSAVVPAEVLGKKPLPGVLVVDRYHAYNRAPVAIEYCYAHLKRDTEGIEKEFPDEPEVAAFVESLAPALCEAMTLRTLGLPPQGIPPPRRAHQTPDHRRDEPPGAPPGHPEDPEYLPQAQGPALPLGARPVHPGGKQPGRTRPAPPRHRAQGLLRLPVPSRRAHPRNAHERPPHAQEAPCQPRLRYPVRAGSARTKPLP